MNNPFILICPNCKQEIENCRHDKFVTHLRKYHLGWALSQLASRIQGEEMNDWRVDKKEYRELIRDCLKEQLKENEIRR